MSSLFDFIGVVEIFPVQYADVSSNIAQRKNSCVSNRNSGKGPLFLPIPSGIISVSEFGSLKMWNWDGKSLVEFPRG